MAKRARRKVAKAAKKKKTAHNARAAPTQDKPVITIRARDRKTEIEARVLRSAGPLLERLAREWAYILRTRPRWNDDEDLRQSLGERALKDLERLGVPRATMQHLTVVRHIEVELHGWAPNDTSAPVHEAASEIPWEYLLSAGTRCLGRFEPVLVTRLHRNPSPPTLPLRPDRVLFVESAPGRLDDEYGFDSERVRIRAAVGAERERVIDPDGEEDDAEATRQREDTAARVLDVLKSPKERALRQAVYGTPWDVIHVSGVDTHQVTQYIDLYGELEKKKPAVWKQTIDASGRILDGMILHRRDVAELPVNYRDLAELLVNDKRPPSVITLNLYHSGARIARELVRRGAYAAIGFLDEIDDELAELFFQSFYTAWCRRVSPKSIVEAFLAAWQKMDSDSLHGASIVIWIGQSVFEKVRLTAGARTPAMLAGPSEPEQSVDTMPMSQVLQVDFAIGPEVNYSLLHNDRQLIEKLTLTKLVREPLHNIAVTVELNLGGENYPYRCTRVLFDEPQIALAADVKIPLTATLPRSLRERVQSTVYVKVTCENRTAFEVTKRVTLIPVDEWLDDTDNNPWLPSFVLPRDPAILKIINASRRYLIGIADDPAAGFDGYQSIDDDADDPSAGIDKQVQAIWTALVNEYRIQYINPPPAYSEQTQRLRTPNDIVNSNTGTCIDLALLLASCLEYVDIYPVVVLLTGHAFVGYWRSEDAHEDFVKVKTVPSSVPAVGSPSARATGLPYVDRYGWRLTKLNYEEIMSFVMAGKLVMLEATYLTGAYKFSEAVDEGRANLRSRREFDSMLDIRLARTAAPPVTPLPIINE